MTKTRQEIFNMTYKGLEAQGWEQSRSPDGPCKYRGPNGLKCAVGHCIPDEDYREFFDAKPVGLVTIINVANLDRRDYALISALQHSHDGASSPKNMKERILRVASIFSLEVPA